MQRRAVVPDRLRRKLDPGDRYPPGLPGAITNIERCIGNRIDPGTQPAVDFADAPIFRRLPVKYASEAPLSTLDQPFVR